MKISFIVPAHNAADYIVRSVHSIIDLVKNRVSYEVLIVENGSEDNTLKLAAGLADDYAEVRVLHSGTSLAKARNVGIRHASGEWIFFVDADDLCEPGMMKAIPLLEKYKPEIFTAGFRKGKGAVYTRYRICNHLISGKGLESAKAWMVSAPTLRMTAWSKFYSRDFLISNDLFFDESLARSEDSEFLIRALNCCKKLLISDLIVYNYSQDSSSMMRSVLQGIAPSYLEPIRKAEKTAAKGSPGIRAAYPEFVYSMILIVAVHDFYDSAVRIPWAVRSRSMVRFLQEGPVKRALARMSFRALMKPRNWPVFFFKCRLINLGGAVCYLRSFYNRHQWQGEGTEPWT